MFFMRPRPHSRGQLVIQLSIAIVPQQMIYYSHSWYLWFYGHSFSEYILCWLFLDSCSRCSTGFCNAPFDPAWELTGMTLVPSTMPLRSALAYDISHCFSHGSSRWPVSLFPVGCSKLVSKAEFMEAVFVISLRSMFPDGILVTEFGWSIVPGCLLWCAVVLLDWCMTLNFIPQMISAKGYGCITGHFLLILCSISRFEPDVM